MKFIIILCFLIAAVLADHHVHEFHKKTVDDFRKARSECFNKFEVSDDNKGEIKKMKYPDDESVHNYIHCTSSTLGVWCNHGGFHKESLMTQFGDDKAAILDKCITPKNDDWTTAKWAWDNWKCMVDEGLTKEALAKHPIGD